MSENKPEDVQSKSSETIDEKTKDPVPETDADPVNNASTDDTKIPENKDKNSEKANNAGSSETDEEKAKKSKTEASKAPDDKENKKVDEKTEIRGDLNILLLSETGVGKSTFINAVANYLTHKNFERAEKGKLRVLIPAKFQIDDKNGKKQKVSIGDADKNEFLRAGDSATQDVKSYIFPIGKNHPNIRIIDTPGMGDTRGPEQDNKNCDYILNYIGNLRELHAICCLFKPSNTRNTIYFQYCITEILSRLDKSASKNIIFVFTNTRGTNYGSGETHDILQKTLEDIQKKNNVQIPLDQNIFCFDNEAFRYLAAVQKNVKFNPADKEKYRESWKKSLNQFWKLIRYIKSVEPHLVQSTNAINEARRMVTQLAQPLAEISELINDNIDALQKHQEKLNIETMTLEELKQQMFMPVIDLQVVALTQPTTVCAELKCAEIYKVGDKNKWHYKQRCHEPCYLSNVQAETVDNPALLYCAAINHSSGVCNMCGCHYRKHMHVYYETTTIETRIENSNASTNIDDKEKFMEDVKKHIDDMMIRKDELEKEHDTIVTSCAKFTHFLQNNAITPFNDSYKEYIGYLITREQSLGALITNKNSVVHLRNLLKKYEETKKLFDNTLKKSQETGQQISGVTSKEILETVQNLYSLKHSGKKIKELYECQQSSRKKEHQYTEYVHSPMPKYSKDTKSRNNNMKKNDWEYYGRNQNENKNQEGFFRRIVREFFGYPAPKSLKNGPAPTNAWHPNVQYFRNVQKIAGGTGYQGPEEELLYPYLFGNAGQPGGFPYNGILNHQFAGNPNQLNIDPNYYIPNTFQPQANSPNHHPNHSNFTHNPFNYNDPNSPSNPPTAPIYDPSGRYNIPTDPYSGPTTRQYQDHTGRPYQPYGLYADQTVQSDNSTRGKDNSSPRHTVIDNSRYENTTYDRLNGRPADGSKINYPEPPGRYDNEKNAFTTIPDYYENRRNDVRNFRYDDGKWRYDDRPRNDDRPGRYDDRPGRYDDRPGRYDDRRGRYDDRPSRYDDRPSRYDDRRGRYDDRPSRYDDRPGPYDDRPARYDEQTKPYNKQTSRDVPDEKDEHDKRFSERDGNNSEGDGRYNGEGRPYSERERRNDERYERNEDRYGRNDDRYGRYDGRYGRYDRYGRNDDRYGRNDDRYGRYDDRYGRNDDRDGRNDDRDERNDERDDRYNDPKRRYSNQNKSDGNGSTRSSLYDEREGRYDRGAGRSDGGDRQYDDRNGRYNTGDDHLNRQHRGKNDRNERNVDQFDRYDDVQFGFNKEQHSQFEGAAAGVPGKPADVSKIHKDDFINFESKMDNVSSGAENPQIEQNGTKDKKQDQSQKDCPKRGKLRTVVSMKTNKLRNTKKKLNKKNKNGYSSDGWESVEE